MSFLFTLFIESNETVDQIRTFLQLEKIRLPSIFFNCFNFPFYIEIFQNVLNSQAPLKNIEVKTKKENKKWLSKELRSLINEKHGVFNEWKRDPNQELFNSYKVLRNNVYRKLRKASDDYTKQFFENLPTSKEQWKFIKNKFNSNKQTEKIAKLKEGHNIISDEKSIANCLNNCFARLGLYKTCLLLYFRNNCS